MRGMLRCVIAASALLRAAQNICQEANERTSTLEFGIPWKALCTAMHSFARRQGIWLTSGTSMRQYHLSPSFFSLLLNKLLPVFLPVCFSVAAVQRSLAFGAGCHARLGRAGELCSARSKPTETAASHGQTMSNLVKHHKNMQNSCHTANIMSKIAWSKQTSLQTTDKPLPKTQT